MKKEPTINKLHLHGISSIVLFIVALTIAVISVIMHSILAGLVGISLIIVGFAAITVFYCSKCRCRNHCNHLIPGRISRLLSESNIHQYHMTDLIKGLSPMAIAVIFHQFWLVKHTVLLTGFWITFTVAGLEAWLFECPHCKNYKCMLCRNKTIIFQNEE
jgi:hypothetical protein